MRAYRSEVTSFGIVAITQNWGTVLPSLVVTDLGQDNATIVVSCSGSYAFKCLTLGGKDIVIHLQKDSLL